MTKLLFILSVCFGSLAVGYMGQIFLVGRHLVTYDAIKSVSDRMKIFSLVCLLPIPIMHSFWKITFTEGSLFVIPVMGIMSFLIGGLSAILFIRIFRVAPSQAASLFTCGMFTNLSIFGGFIAFVLYRDLGFLVVQLFTMFEVFVYYVIGFPVSHQISRGAIKSLRFNFAWLREQPVAFVPISAIVIGSLLKTFGVYRPPFIEAVSAYLIPGITAFLGIAIGMTLRIGRVGLYRREIAMIMGIKFCIVPLVNIPIAWLLGLGHIMEGVPLKIVAILSFMPVAFVAVIPPAIYGFDLDLANSGWLVTTLAILIIFPVLYFVVI
jgi:predicted permease